MNNARVQFARDTEPLPKASPKLLDDNGPAISEYMQLTEDRTTTENGYEISERRYKDARLERIRHQLATEKLDQALGRARFPVWTDTLTIAFTNAPIARITEQANLFSSHAFNLAESPSGLSEATDRIEKAEAAGDVKAVMETTGVSKRTAERKTKETREHAKAEQDAERDAEIERVLSESPEISLRDLETHLKAKGHKRTHRSKYLKPYIEQRGWAQNDNANYNILIGDVAKCPPHDTCVSGVSTAKERPRPEWHSDDSYSEIAIRERIEAAKEDEKTLKEFAILKRDRKCVEVKD